MNFVKLQKTEPSNSSTAVQKTVVLEAALPGKSFNVQTNRVTSREETYLKIKGSFKIRVQNKGDVDVTIFGNFPLPSYSDETFETGDTNLGFVTDTAIQYPAESVGENINILLTSYLRSHE